MNRKTFFFSFVVALGVGTYLDFTPRQQTSSPRGEAIRVAVATAPPMAIPLSRPLPTPVPVADISPACREYHRKLLSLDLAPMTNARFAVGFEVPLLEPDRFSPIAASLATPEDPCRELPKTHALFPLHHELITYCGPPPAERRGDPVAGKLRLVMCFHQLQVYRAGLVDAQTAATPLTAIHDEKLLLAKLATRFLGDPGHFDYHATTEVADRLEVVSPGKGYGTFALRLRYQEVLATVDNATQARRREALDAYLERQQQETGNASTTEMRILLARDDADAGKMRSLADTLAETHPDKADYYLAWADFIDGNVDESRERLLSLADRSSIARFTLEQLSHAVPGESPFTDAEFGWGTPIAH